MPRLGVYARPVSTAPDLWPAPTLVPGELLDATVVLPGSKSLTNRYLVLAALADGPSVIARPLVSRDTVLMAEALRRLGAVISEVGDGSSGTPWRVTPGALRGGGAVDCGLAGTVMRFLPPVAALAAGATSFDGDSQARERPMGPVLQALTALGADVRTGGVPGRLPFTVHGARGLRGGHARVDASGSSQFVSALLLAAARFERGLLLEHVGGPLPSAPHVEMTAEVLREAGVEVVSGGAGGGAADGTAEGAGSRTWRVEPGPIAGIDVEVEPDLSNAAPFLAAAVLAPEGSRVTVPGWPQRTTQAGDALRDLLDQMGADVDLTRDGLTVTSTGEVYGIEADLHEVGELTPVLTALAALATGPSHLFGVSHLRGHETDRLAGLAAEIGGLGGDVTETADGLLVHPRPLRGGVFGSRADHRMATAGAVLGLLVPGVLVEDVGSTGKTMPDFPGAWSSALGRG